MGEEEEEFTAVDENTTVGPKVTTLAGADPDAWARYYAAWSEAYAEFEPDTVHISKEGAAWLANAPDEGIAAGKYYAKYDGLDDDGIRESLRRDFKAAAEVARRIDGRYGTVSEAAAAVVSEDARYERLAAGYSNGPLRGLDGIVATVSAMLEWRIGDGRGTGDAGELVRTLLDREAGRSPRLVGGMEPRRGDLKASELDVRTPEYGRFTTAMDLLERGGAVWSPTRVEHVTARGVVKAFGSGIYRSEKDVPYGKWPNGKPKIMHIVMIIPDNLTTSDGKPFTYDEFDFVVDSTIFREGREKIQRSYPDYKDGKPYPVPSKGSGRGPERWIPGGYNPSLAHLAKVCYGTGRPSPGRLDDIAERLYLHSRCRVLATPYDEEGTPFDIDPTTEIEKSEDHPLLDFSYNDVLLTSDGLELVYVKFKRLPELPYVYDYMYQTVLLKSDYVTADDIDELDVKRASRRAWEIANEGNYWDKAKLEKEHPRKRLTLIANEETAVMKNTIIQTLGLGGNKGIGSLREYDEEWGREGVIIDINETIAKAWSTADPGDGRRGHMGELGTFLLFSMTRREGAVLDFKIKTTADYSAEELAEKFGIVKGRGRHYPVCFLVLLPEKEEGRGTLYMKPIDPQDSDENRSVQSKIV